MSARRRVPVESASPPPPSENLPYPDDLAYLQDELVWLSARAERVRCEQMLQRLAAGRAPVRQAWQREAPALSNTELHRRVGVGRVAEETERARIDARLAAGRAQGRETALDRLCRIHRLVDLDRLVLLAAVAPILERRFEDLIGSLSRHGEGSTVTIEAALALADLDLGERLEAYQRFSPRAPLVAHDLIVARQVTAFTPRDLMDVDLDLPNRTFELLVGRDGLRSDFESFSAIEVPRATMAQIVLPSAEKDRILAVVDKRDAVVAARRAWGLDDVITYGRGAMMLFHGPPGTGKTLTAHAVAHHMGLRVLTVDLPTFMAHAQANAFLPGLFREARVQNAVLFFDECETLFESRSRGNVLMTVLLTELEKFEGVAILATNMPEVLDAALERRLLVRVAFPPPDREARREIWRQHLPPTVPLARDVDLEVLADRFDLSGGYIKNAVLTATAEAVRTGGKRPKVTMAHLAAAAQAQTLRLSGTGASGRVIAPKATLADVMLPDGVREQVVELVDAARNRRTVLERWGIGRHLTHGRGVSALFSGPPGTGKTLCAEAVAGELSRPLTTGSASTLLSKWVGESEQNVAGLFSEARRTGAVVFLDEIDALLGERGDSPAGQPRHEISLVNTLLTEIERFEGLVLLATNRPGALDAALERRLTYRLDFPFPDATLRAGIWRRLLPDTVPVAEPIDFEALGRAHALAGGHIKNAVFKAAFRAARGARPLTGSDLDLAAREETDGRLRPRSATIGFAGAH